MTQKILLTSKMADAFSVSLIAHEKQYRKSTGVPYLSHPMMVAGLVLEFGGNENEAIAGLLHDVIEDAGDVYQSIILEKFGIDVLDIVMGCTDGSQEEKKRPKDREAKKANWWERKNKYISHLKQASPSVLLVSGCDKLHNARCCLRDLEIQGLDLYKSFIGDEDGTLWYYQTISQVFLEKNHPIAQPLNKVVKSLTIQTEKLHKILESESILNSSHGMAFKI